MDFTNLLFSERALCSTLDISRRLANTLLGVGHAMPGRGWYHQTFYEKNEQEPVDYYD